MAEYSAIKKQLDKINRLIDESGRRIDSSHSEIDKAACSAEGSTGERKSSAGSGRLLIFAIKLFVTVLVISILLPPFILPLSGVKTSGYSIRLRPENPVWGQLEVHRGIDIAAAQGTFVTTTAIGRVSRVGYSETLGNFVDIEHLLGFSSRYAHLSEITVPQGRFVVPGLSQIGRVGQSGRATGPHLHFEIHFLKKSTPPSICLIFYRLNKIFIKLS